MIPDALLAKLGEQDLNEFARGFAMGTVVLDFGRGKRIELSGDKFENWFKDKKDLEVREFKVNRKTLSFSAIISN